MSASFKLEDMAVESILKCFQKIYQRLTVAKNIGQMIPPLQGTGRNILVLERLALIQIGDEQGENKQPVLELFAEQPSSSLESVCRG